MNYVKKGMPLLILLVALNSVTYSQSTADSILCLPIKDARAAVKIIEGLRIDSMILARDNQVLQERVTARDNIITNLYGRMDTYKNLVANYDKREANLDKQVELSTGLNKSLGKSLRWANTKTVLVGLAGIAATVLAAVYIK